MGKKCLAFDMEDVGEAWKHMELEIIEDYGDRAYGHFLHMWDDGKRMLGRCRKCGGYVLVQKSEFHSFTDGDDSYYSDYFPVSGREEADSLNRQFNGSEIERAFPERYLRVTNLRLSWSGRSV